MATVDKIYGTNNQYHEFYSWCEQNYPGACHYFYPENGYENNDDRPITNFPRGIDYWLIAHCPIDWVQERLQEQYDEDYNDIRAGKIQAIDLIHNEAIKDDWRIEDGKHTFDERKSKYWIRLVYPAGLSFCYPGDDYIYTKNEISIYGDNEKQLIDLAEELLHNDSLAFAELWKMKYKKWNYQRDWFDDSFFYTNEEDEQIFKNDFDDENGYLDENKVKDFWCENHTPLEVLPDSPLYYYLLYSPKID